MVILLMSFEQPSLGKTKRRVLPFLSDLDFSKYLLRALTGESDLSSISETVQLGSQNWLPLALWNQPPEGD